MKYPHPTPDSDMAKEPAASMPQQTISPVDALWALYQSQPKKVRKAFQKRIIEDSALSSQEFVIKESLYKAFDELHSGQVKHDARNLFVD